MKYSWLIFILLPMFSVSAQKSAFVCPALDSIVFPECGMAKLMDGKKSDTTCAIRKRLRPFADYLIAKEKPCSTLTEDIGKRYEFIRDTTTFPIKTDLIQWIGDTTAPVTIIMYVSMMCPHCKQLYGQLYDTLQVNKKLAHRIRIGLKNLSTTEYDHMFVGAALLGKQPRFMRAFGRMSERACDETMERVADSIGVPFDTLKAMPNNVMIARKVNSSREEGLRNGVTSTPGIFINNRRYRSSKDIRWILEAALALSPK